MCRTAPGGECPPTGGRFFVWSYENAGKKKTAKEKIDFPRPGWYNITIPPAKWEELPPHSVDSIPESNEKHNSLAKLVSTLPCVS